MHKNPMRLVTLVHILLSVFGAGLCTSRNLEGGGVLILAFSAMCLMIVKVDHIVSIDASDGAPELSEDLDLDRANDVLNTIYRRTATLANMMDVTVDLRERMPLQLAHILRTIDSTDLGVDTAIHHLRDHILMRSKAPSPDTRDAPAT